ncbi:MAG TPA: IS200/IS605 family transposase [Acidobacteriota bacterium]|nr:IS200/IS605 family transposase [Acidobacteriota bacterium]
MPQSLAQLWIHIIFSTKARYPFFQDPLLRDEVFAYLSEVCRRVDCPSALTGGHRDHVHILCRQSKNLSTSQLVGELKRQSSKWIKAKGGMLSKFYWQGGYGAFSVGPSQLGPIKDYIRKQEEHHKQVDFKTEFRRFLDRYQVAYDERYVWD